MRNVFLLGALATTLAAQAPVPLDFWRTIEDGKQAGTMLPKYLRAMAEKQFEKRDQRVRETRDWDAWRSKFRADLIDSLGGPFPEKTPLKPSVTGVLQRDGYRIEKVVFESRPKFFVTANLYVPDQGTGPFPAILFPLGHEAGGKAHGAWQIVLSNLAKRGFVLLAWEPIGQGERVQLYDEDWRGSKLVQSTTEHTMQGIQTLLVGDALARYTIWDGIRALDYLLSRKEVDTKRVGITGNSGGGTHTSYISALEDRLHAAAPSCYLTTWRKLLDTIGPQDAEQCFPRWLAYGYDHPDFVYAFAPRPFAMLTAIRDFFSIAGARDTYAEGARLYDSLGAAEKFIKVEVDDGHGYNKGRREAAYRWFTRWLKGAEDTTPEHEIALASETELFATPTGQVATSLRGETVHSLNLARWKEVRKPGTLEDAKKLARWTENRPIPKVRPYGIADLGSGLRMEKLIIEPEAGIALPAVLVRSASNSGALPATIVVHGRGKQAAYDLVRDLAAKGQAVLALDVRGMGETSTGAGARAGEWSRSFGDYHSAMTAILLDKPLVTMRAEDIAAAVSVLAARRDIDGKRISLYGIEGGAIPSIYAAAFDSRIAGLVLDQALVSYESVIRRKIHRGVFEHIVVGALRTYDLPDLLSWTAPRPVKILNRVDPLGLPVMP